MPELTVSMPARNTSRFIGEAISSVLFESGVDIELIVVDDASDDNTAGVASSFGDPRVKIIRNPVRRGISGCHNIVIENSLAPFIAHVDSDDVILPGALEKMLDALRSSPGAGQSHCNFHCIDDESRRLDITLSSVKQPGINYKRELLVRGGVINHLRTYRKEIFRDIGGFDETIEYSEDTEMALRIIERYGIVLVPEFLYLRRVHAGSSSDSLALKELRYWLQRYRFARKLVKNRKVTYPSGGEYDFNRLIAAGFIRALISFASRISRPMGNKLQTTGKAQ